MKAKLRSNEAAEVAVRTHLPLAEDELPDVFHLTAESCLDPPRAVLRSVKTADGTVQLQLMWRPKLQPISQPSSSFDLYPSFLDGLPFLSPEQREGLERPLTLAELETVVDSTSHLDWSLSF